MDEAAIDEEMKLGELMRNDIGKELDVLQTVSSSLLRLDLKRKRIESHFESLAKTIKRNRDEAIEAIRVREEERLEKLRLKEARVEKLRKGVFGEIFVRSKGIDKEMEKLERFERRLKVREVEVERRVAEIERRAVELKEMEEAKMDLERLCVELIGKERETVDLRKAVGECKVENERRDAELKEMGKEIEEAKMDVERLCVELIGKERENVELRKAVDECKVESERRDAECRKLADENLALREEAKSLCEKLEVKAKVPGQEEQLEAIQKFLHVLTAAGIIRICDPLKESKVRGQELFITVKGNINDQGAAISKVSSLLLEAKDNAPQVVVEALRISYLNESEEKNSQSLLVPCRILLLEQLSHICPQQKSQARNEALKVAREWSAQIESCGLKSVEISRFLQFLSMYDIASEFGDEVLLPLLQCVAVHEGYIKTMNGRNQRLKALDYVTTFKMEKEFPVDKIIQGHLKGLKRKCRRMLKKGVDKNVAQVQVFDLEINTLKELLKCIKDLKLQNIYSVRNLEESMAKLEKQKCINKRPAPCADPNSDVEPPRKKGCNRFGTTKSPEVIPAVENASPGIRRDLLCSGPNSDSVPLRNNKSEVPETVKSAKTSPSASDGCPEIRSRDFLSSQPNSYPETQMKNGIKLPGTAKLPGVAQNKSNAYQETGSRDVVSSKSYSDPEPLRSKGCNLPGTAKLTEITSNTSSADTKIVSSDVFCSKPITNPEPMRNICNFPVPAKPQDVVPKGTLNAHTENRSRDSLSSDPNSYLQPQRKNEHKLPETTKLPTAAQNASNEFPETGLKGTLSSKPRPSIDPEQLGNKGYLLPGTAKLREVVLNTSNAYPKIIPRDALCSKVNVNPEPWSNIGCNLSRPAKPQEVAPKGYLNACTDSRARDALHFQNMQKAPFPNDPQPQVPSWHPLPTRPPQYYHPCPPLRGSPQPQVPSWHHSVPNTPPFHYRH